MLVLPERTWYVSELARRMGVPPSSLQRELQSLTRAGILKTHRQGRMVYVQANTDSPVFPDLRSLLLKTAGLRDVLDGSMPLDEDALRGLSDARPGTLPWKRDSADMHGG